MVFLFISSRQQSLRNISIHPHSATAVADTRSRLQNIQQPTSSSASTRRHVRTDRTCPICLADARFGIETNCGHLFCGMFNRFSEMVKNMTSLRLYLPNRSDST